MKLFQQHPQIKYLGSESTNLVTRATIYKKVFEKYRTFYDYKVTEGERPDTIAHDYYGEATFDWLILLSNNIINVYDQWPKSHDVWIEYLENKYGTVNSLMNTISHYRYTGENKLRVVHKMTPRTYAALTVDERYGWEPVMIYDYEFELNENKRNIKLLSNTYIPQVKRELRELFS